MMINFKKMSEKFIKHAKETISNGDMVFPICIASQPGDEIGIIPFVFKTDEEKENLLNNVRLLFSLKEVTSYMVVHEAWFMVKKSLDEFKEILPLRNQEEKKECVMVIYAEKTKDKKINKKMITIPFEKKDKKVIFDDNIEFTETSDYCGDFGDLLSPKDINDILNPDQKKFMLNHMEKRGHFSKYSFDDSEEISFDDFLNKFNL